MNATAKEYYEKSKGELRLTWRDVEDAACEVITRIKEDGNDIDAIVSIARSGLIPASIISYAIGNKELYVVKTDFSRIQTMGKEQILRDKPKITQELTRDIEGLNILVVDEMAVSGSTLKLVASYLEMKQPKSIKYAVLYKQPWSEFKPDYFGVETDYWPVFPWKRLKDY